MRLFVSIITGGTPMPTPDADENRDEFLSRCMGDEEMVSEFSDTAQRYAVCISKWEADLETDDATPDA